MQFQRNSNVELNQMSADALNPERASLDMIKARERTFIQGVYGWMFGGLLVTTLGAAWVMMSPPMQGFVRDYLFILIMAELGLVVALSFGINRLSPLAATTMFMTYSFLNGLTIAAVIMVYTVGSVLGAFTVAAGMFAAMSVYGLVTRRDLTSWGSFFFMGLIGLLLVMVVNGFFLRSPGLDFTISIIGVFIFVGLTAYDTQKLKAYARVGGGRETNYAIFGALRLYLDFINLFLMLLRLFGRRN